MSVPVPPAMGGPLADALAAAEPAAAQQLQQLAAPAGDAAAKAAALQAQADETAPAATSAAEAAAAGAAQDLGKQFSPTTPTGVPAVPCACAECIKPAVDPAA
jgi:hypothetical protein